MKRLMPRLLSVLTVMMVCATDADAARYVIEIKDMKFAAAPANLKVGDTIEWKNSDIFRHTATARTGRFDIDLPAGARATVTLREPGAVIVYCRFHPNMTVTFRVQ